MKPYTIARLPEFHFGEGKISQVPALIAARGYRSVAVVTGGGSFRASSAWAGLEAGLSAAGIAREVFSVPGEPSPDLVDSMARSLRERKDGVDCVLSVGGGSAIDAGKSLAAALTMEGSIADYLEGVGTKTPKGTKLPFFAVPTTAGPGSEATKNAVLSRIGKGGFKKSLRHDNYVPDVAVVDPLLALSCPAAVTAASGLDAITQLIEAYTSTRATPFTDSLAIKALEIAGRSRVPAFRDGGDREARAGMAYAAYVSGICLANAGLGVVHGIASVMGGAFAIPHGVVCGTLVAEATRYTVARAMKIDDAAEDSVIRKYARAGVALSGRDAASDVGNAALLVKTLERFIEETGIPTLGAYGIAAADLGAIAERTEAKSHPIPLSSDDVRAILEGRLA